MDPGLVDRSILYNQEVHQFLLIWEGNDPRELIVDVVKLVYIVIVF